MKTKEEEHLLNVDKETLAGCAGREVADELFKVGQTERLM